MHDIDGTSVDLHGSDTDASGGFLCGRSKYSNHYKHGFHLLHAALRGMSAPADACIPVTDRLMGHGRGGSFEDMSLKYNA